MTRSNGKLKSSKLANRHRAAKQFEGALTVFRPTVVPKLTSQKVVQSTAPWATSRDMVLAFIMALGLSAVFLSPFRFSRLLQADSKTPKTGGQVLGVSISVPLAVQVVIQQADQEWRSMTYPRTGMIAEALSQAAGAAGSSLQYQSRGSSIYLQRLLNLGDDVSGSWMVSVNGAVVTDLSLRSLEQGDEVRAEWRQR